MGTGQNSDNSEIVRDENGDTPNSDMQKTSL